MPKRHPGTLRVWSYQSWAAYQILLTEGSLAGQLGLVDPDWEPCYQFLIEHMARVLEPPSGPDASPLWVWVKPGEGKQRKPRGKWDGHVLLTLDVPAHLLVQSDFHAWNIILNQDGLAPYPSTEFVVLQERISEIGSDSQKRFDLVQPTRHRVFDLQWCGNNPYINNHPEQQQVQGTLWEIRLGWVKRAEHLEHAEQTFPAHWQARQQNLQQPDHP